jgi:hypothetical protein
VGHPNFDSLASVLEESILQILLINKFGTAFAALIIIDKIEN